LYVWLIGGYTVDGAVIGFRDSGNDFHEVAAISNNQHISVTAFDHPLHKIIRLCEP
jgi:hypothetical protein